MFAIVYKIELPQKKNTLDKFLQSHNVSRSIQDDGQPQVAHSRQGFHATGDLQEQKALDILSLLTKI